MTFVHGELIGAEVIPVTPDGWFLRSARRHPGEAKEIIETTIEMDCDEAKQYCIDAYRAGRFVYLMHNGLVWCDSWSYGLEYEEEKVIQAEKESLKIREVLDEVVKDEEGNEVMRVGEWMSVSILTPNDYVSELNKELKENDMKTI